MPDYNYYCNECHYGITVTHGMVAIEDLPNDIKKQLLCKTEPCEQYNKPLSRDYGGIQLAGFAGGTSKTEKQLLKLKQKERKLRSKRHFKREVLPNLNETPKITEHFNKKFKDI